MIVHPRWGPRERSRSPSIVATIPKRELLLSSKPACVRAWVLREHIEGS